MDYKKNEHFSRRFQRMVIPWTSLAQRRVVKCVLPSPLRLLLIFMVLGLSSHAQVKPILPKKPHLYSRAVKASSPGYVPDGYIQVGNTDLCYYNGSSYIDVKGFFNGSWYQSTYYNSGYKVAISVIKEENDTEEPDIFGSYTVNSWRGYERYWSNGEYFDEYYVGDDYYTALLTDCGDNTVRLTNFAYFGGSVIGTINREDHTIIFPAQPIYMDNWGETGLFCKQTEEFVTTPSEENATATVVATYDDDYNITMDGWAILVSYGDDRLIYGDNTLSMSRNSSDPNGAYTTMCEDGGIYDGVKFSSSVEQQGELSRICYTITNKNSVDVTISLGTHADVMIGNNDRAPISRRIDTFGQTYGLTMKDGNGAQLCVLFGSGLAGVTAVSDFWFGYYYTNNEPYQMVGNYSGDSNYMQENGSYDSGMGWCWKNRTIPAGATVVFSYVIGVGEVNLEPNSSFEATPDDPEGWNDLSRPHKLTLNGTYESPAGLEGVIDYAVEDSEEWIALTDTLSSGEEFTDSLVAMFDATKPIHVIKFRTRDLVGNTTLLHPIEYLDVSFHELAGIEDKVFTGDSLYQTGTTCDLGDDRFVLKGYRNNVNAGTAYFNLEGVFPYTIGRKTYTFTIKPQPLSGEVTLAETEFVYNGHTFTPEWQFTNEHYADLEYDKDYSLSWSNNRLPGTGTLTVTGKNNYTGSLTATLFIDKAQLRDDLFILTLPDEDITYDEQSHGASISKPTGVGNATITYLKQGEAEAVAVQPSEAGDYAIFLEFADGTLYYGRERTQVGAFSIYQFNAEEWAILQALLPQLVEMGWSQPWDVSQGMKCVSSLRGLTIEKGHVTELDLSGQTLTGMFPYAVLSLPQLQRIDLSNNSLSGDISASVSEIVQEHPEWLANVKELDISGNGFSGNIAPFANSLPALTSLDASGNCLEEVTPAISSSVTTLDLGKQSITNVVPLHLADLSATSFAATIPNILLYDHTNQTYGTNIELLCTTADDSWGMAIAYRNGQISLSCLTEQNAYYGACGDSLHVTASYYNNKDTREGSTFRIALSFDPGDANFVDGVDATDLQATILYAFGAYGAHPFNFTAANTYPDDLINVQDVIRTVDILLTAAPNESAQNSVKMSHGKSAMDDLVGEETEACVYLYKGKLCLRSNVPVASLSIQAKGDVTWNLTRFGMQQSTVGGNVVGYSLVGATIPANEDVILGEYGEIEIRSVSLSDSDAQPISVGVKSKEATSVSDILESDLGNTDIYDISGTKHHTLQEGVNIIRRNGSTIKIYTK